MTSRKKTIESPDFKLKLINGFVSEIFLNNLILTSPDFINKNSDV